METPDASEYIDLSLDDRDPQDVYEAAIAQMQIDLPEWTPREGNIEVMLLEALALEVGELVYAINRVPNNVLQGLLALLGVTKDQGVPATTSLVFNLSTTAATTIPAGTTAILELPNNLDPVTFTTDNEVTSVEGSTTVTVTATSIEYTDDANGMPSGTYVIAVDSLMYVDSVQLASDVTGGRGPEDDSVYFQRGVQTLGRLTQTLVVPENFEQAALEELYVSRANALDNYNSAADVGVDGPVGSDPGYIAVAVYGNNEMVSAPNKSLLLAKLESLSMAALTVTVIDPTITAVNVDVSVRPLRDWDAATVQANVAAAIDAFLDPMNWEWKTKVYRNELLSVISNADGVDFVDTLTAPAADVNLAGVATLANAGTVSVTVLAAV